VSLCCRKALGTASGLAQSQPAAVCFWPPCSRQAIECGRLLVPCTQSRASCLCADPTNPPRLRPFALGRSHVHTFHIWQHLIDFSSYKLSVGGLVNLDLAAALNAQPLQLTCKDIKVGGGLGFKGSGPGFSCQSTNWQL
jgi:hypothetical protein